MSGSLRSFSALQFAALLAFVASVFFWAFFQMSKLPDFAAVNPFADDPVDAIGSMAVQVALAVSLLTLARAAQVAHTPYKSRLIVHGNVVALLAIVITLAADTLTVLRQSTPGNSLWSQLLLIGLGMVATITCAAILMTLCAVQNGKAEPTAQRQAIDEVSALGEALGDIWALARLILAWFSHHLPWLSRPLRWVDQLGNRLFEWVMSWRWIGPRVHPWRFCAGVALTVGVALAAVHNLEEGPSFNLATTILTWTIFIVVEVTAVLAGFLLVGGFLGLRPPLSGRCSHSE
jgi:magnesium-transporting ATPase (P-type)